MNNQTPVNGVMNGDSVEMGLLNKELNESMLDGHHVVN